MWLNVSGSEAGWYMNEETRDLIAKRMPGSFLGCASGTTLDPNGVKGKHVFIPRGKPWGMIPFIALIRDHETRLEKIRDLVESALENEIEYRRGSCSCSFSGKLSIAV